MSEQLIQRDDDILGGTPVFAGTRVPVQTLFDYLEEGDSLDEFLDDFPSVTRDHAVKVLEKMKETITRMADLNFLRGEKDVENRTC